jgi:hypothetical protein
MAKKKVTDTTEEKHESAEVFVHAANTGAVDAPIMTVSGNCTDLECVRNALTIAGVPYTSSYPNGDVLVLPARRLRFDEKGRYVG